MQRRDANIDLQGAGPRRRALLSGTASVAVHAALLLLAATAVLPTLHPLELIRVALRPGGGDDRPNGCRDATCGGPEVAPAAAPVAVAPPRPAPRANKPNPARRDAARIAARPALPQPVDAAPAGTDESIGAATGATGGPGSDVARDAGGGSGTGSGGGIGSRVGGGDDTRPYCAYCPEPSYPLIARRRGWKGTVDVGLVLLADGRVDSATLRRSSGFEVLDREAIDVARRSRFRFPSETPGGSVYGRIEYRFELLPE